MRPISYICLDLRNNTFIGSGNEDHTELDLGYMPTLTEVCVWTTPFPPSGMEINISGSENLYFTENCQGCITGLENIPDSNISVYPNPVDDIITIRSAHAGTHFGGDYFSQGSADFNSGNGWYHPSNRPLLLPERSLYHHPQVEGLFNYQEDY